MVVSTGEFDFRMRAAGIKHFDNARRLLRLSQKLVTCKDHITRNGKQDCTDQAKDQASYQVDASAGRMIHIFVWWFDISVCPVH